jgi:hypothetical protein
VRATSRQFTQRWRFSSTITVAASFSWRCSLDVLGRRPVRAVELETGRAPLSDDVERRAERSRTSRARAPVDERLVAQDAARGVDRDAARIV